MKHNRKSRKDQIPLTSSESSTEPLRLQIKDKLNSLFDGFVSDLQTISREAEPDFTVLLDSHVSQFVNGSNHNGTESSAPSRDHALLQNFVNSAKSRLSGLLNQEKSCVSNGLSRETGTPHKSLKKSGYVDPLQTHISQKVQWLLCNALDEKLANGQKNHSDSFINSELEGFTSVLQNFVNSAKRKISLSLTDGHSPQSTVTSHTVGAKKNKQDFVNSSKRKTSPTLTEGRTPQLPVASRVAGAKKSEPEGCASDLRNFLSSSKQKLSLSLSNGQGRHLPATSRTKKSESCNILSGGSSKSVSLIDLSNSNSRAAESGTISSHQRKSSLRSSSQMYSPCDSDCLEEEVLCIPDARNCKNATGGMLLLEDAERAPDFLDIEINTDIEDDASSSDEDVIVLGEKRPTYEEITLEEDDDDDDYSPEKKEDENFFKCPQCEKAFRVESLLKFHIRMHGNEEPLEEEGSSLKRKSTNEEERPTKAAKIHESSIGKDKENQTNPNTSQSKKSRQEKPLKPGRRKQTSKH